MNRSLLPIAFGILLVLSWLVGCTTDPPSDAPVQPVEAPVAIEAPDFRADSAYAHIATQVSFGPRVPNTPAHDSCLAWMVRVLTPLADTVILQRADLTAFDGTVLHSTNVIASFDPDRAKRVLLCAHWDTRPFADQARDDKRSPITGANDGGSGVGVLLEIARLLHAHPVDVGVDIILFDAEDYGQPSFSDLPYVPDSYCLGSQHWARNPHVRGYDAQFGILLDMVGAEGAIFTKEAISRYFASAYVDQVWSTADRLGFGTYFVQQNTGEIVDDHLYINQILNVPTLDIIQHDPTTGHGFGWYWHTHDDDMDVISEATLEAVGQTVTQVVYEFSAGRF